MKSGHTKVCYRILWLAKLWCRLRGHKVSKTERAWDMVGNPLTDSWAEYHCSQCGLVKDFYYKGKSDVGPDELRAS